MFMQHEESYYDVFSVGPFISLRVGVGDLLLGSVLFSVSDPLALRTGGPFDVACGGLPARELPFCGGGREWVRRGLGGGGGGGVNC